MVITCTGWTVRDVDDCPWNQLLDLITYWHNNPPTAASLKKILASEFFGYTFDEKPSDSESTLEEEDGEVMTEAEIDELVRTYGRG